MIPPAPVVRYGPHPDQVANLHLPAAEGGPWPCVLLIHGGFWRERWDRTLTTPLAIDLAQRGYAAWNIEYRRVGQEGGGWPGTLLDISASTDALVDQPAIDRDRVIAVGHSAGGQLALNLAASRPGLRGVVVLAGVCDLARAHADRLGDGAVADFLGGLGPSDQPDFGTRLRLASPIEMIPLLPQLLIHGARDEIVPPTQSRGYADRALAGGAEIELVEIAGADHFDVVDPAHEAWRAVVTRLPQLLGTA
jgi:acetyl esterase/lipase